MSNREFKPGDRVLVEAVFNNIDKDGAAVLSTRWKNGHLAGNVWADPQHVHPLPAFMLEEVDVECGEAEYPSIKPSEMRVGDVVKPSDCDWGRQVLTVVKEDAVAWVIVGERKASMWCDSEMLSYSWHWQLTRRDGVDQGKRKRMRYCDLPEGKYVMQSACGKWYGINHFSNADKVSNGYRIFRVVGVK